MTELRLATGTVSVDLRGVRQLAEAIRLEVLVVAWLKRDLLRSFLWVIRAIGRFHLTGPVVSLGWAYTAGLLRDVKR